MGFRPVSSADRLEADPRSLAAYFGACPNSDDSSRATAVSAVLKLETGLGNTGTADTAVAQDACGLMNNPGSRLFPRNLEMRSAVPLTLGAVAWIYYVRVLQHDDELAWSSPVWFGAP